MMTRKQSHNRLGLACATMFLGAALAGCSGSSGDGGGGGGGGPVNNNLYPSTPLSGSALLLDPSHILKLPDGNFLISDMTGANVVKIIDPAGNLVATLGTAGPPSNAPGQFDGPEGIAVAPDGNVYIVDSNNSRVQIFSQTGTYISSFGDPSMTDPESVTVDSSGNAWVVDDIGNDVLEFNAAGTLVTTFGTTGPGALSQPIDIVLAPNGALVIDDMGNNRMVGFSKTGTFLGTFGTKGSGNGQFLHPVGICFDSNGNFYVNDAGNGRVVEFNTKYEYVYNYQYRDPKAVSVDQKSSLEGFGLFVDSSGNIYVVMAGTSYVLAPHK